MSTSITGITTTSLQETTNNSEKTSSVAKKTQETEQSTAAATTDKVEISATAQARLLKKQGESVTQIATALGVSSKTVQEYLGISSSSSENAEVLALLQ
jgi:DNA-binding NarL/FixJ family response regulator